MSKQKTDRKFAWRTTLIIRIQRAIKRAVVPSCIVVGLIVALSDAALTDEAKWRSQMDAAAKATGQYNYSRARRHLDTALAEAESLGGAALVETLAELGDVRRILGHPREARALLDRANQIGDAKLGDSHPLVVKTLFNTGVFLHDYGDLRGAEATYRRALGLVGNRRDPDDPLYSDIEDKLAVILVNRGAVDDAERLLDRSLDRRQRQAQADTRAIAETLATLGKVYYRQNRLDRSETALTEARQLARRAVGAGAPLHMAIGRDLLDVQITRDIAREYSDRRGVLRDAVNGIDIVVVPPTGTTGPDQARRALASIKQALDLLYQNSPFMVGKLKALIGGGRPVVIFDPRFPFGAVSAQVGAFFPYVVAPGNETAPRRRLPVVVGRNIVAHAANVDPASSRWNTVDLALTLAHELVGHGLQNLRWNDRLTRADGECEALLYEYQAHKDLKVFMNTEFSVDVRRQIEQQWCHGFKRFIADNVPGETALWRARDLDIGRLTQLFDRYARAVMRPN